MPKHGCQVRDYFSLFATRIEKEEINKALNILRSREKLKKNSKIIDIHSKF